MKVGGGSEVDVDVEVDVEVEVGVEVEWRCGGWRCRWSGFGI